MTQPPLYPDNFSPAAATDAELQSHKTRLLDELTLIDQQLSEPARTRSDGSRLGQQEYDHWRHQAIRAKNAKLRQYRAVKSELARRENKRRGRDA